MRGNKRKKPPIVEGSPSEEWFEEIGLGDVPTMEKSATKRHPAKKKEKR